MKARRKRSLHLKIVEKKRLLLLLKSQWTQKTNSEEEEKNDETRENKKTNLELNEEQQCRIRLMFYKKFYVSLARARD